MFKKIPGTRDIFPEETSSWQEIERLSRNVFSIYNYKEIRTPLIEDVGLFNRCLGEFAEIVQKQMFLIKNQQDIYALRPEGTASIVRAFIEGNLDKTARFIKLYYLGPMFRLERPQKGRLRQFHHIGAEVIGSSQPEVDVEVISLADTLLKAYQIRGYKIKINTLGCLKDKKELINIVHKELQKKLKYLCQDCQRRFKHNTLRILDCKKKTCQEIVGTLDIQDKYLCFECIANFSKVRQGLSNLKIDYEISPFLVRGLDYYTRTVFEIKHASLGSQDALGAGGRYDNLVKDLGGPNLGAIGFAFGVERLLLVTSYQLPVTSKNLVYLITLGEEAKVEGLKILNELRQTGIATDTDYENKSLKGAMRKAGNLGARFVVIIGEEELKKNVVTLKDMTSGEQKETKTENLINELMSNVKILPLEKRENFVL